MEIRNFTGKMERGEAFVRAKAELADTSDLSVHIKFTKAKGRDVNGYYRWKDRRMVLAVKQRLRYPRAAAYGVGTTPRPDRRLGGLPYRLVWHEERFESPDDLLVFVAGHEFWHFLCHSGQRKRDHETKANCHGFAWLAEFRAWAPGMAVAEIPAVPPRPDRPVADALPAPVVPASPPPNPTPLFGFDVRTRIAAMAPTRGRPAAVAGSEAAAPTRPGLLQTAKQLFLFR